MSNEKYVIVGYITNRNEIESQLKSCIDFVSQKCYYCGNCWECQVTKTFQIEIEKKGFKTFNSEKKWWRLDWRKIKNGDSLPVLICI